MALNPCAECGFDPASLTPATVATQLRQAVAELERLVDGVPASRLRQRGAGLAWSPLEYVGHVRDVMALFTTRVQLVTAADRPDLPVVDHNSLVADGDYRAQDPDGLLHDLAAHTEALGQLLTGLPAGAWRRIGLRAGERRSVLEIARRAVHEARHHRWDIERSLPTSEPHASTPTHQWPRSDACSV